MEFIVLIHVSQVSHSLLTTRWILQSEMHKHRNQPRMKTASSDFFRSCVPSRPGRLDRSVLCSATDWSRFINLKCFKCEDTFGLTVKSKNHQHIWYLQQKLCWIVPLGGWRKDLFSLSAACRTMMRSLCVTWNTAATVKDPKNVQMCKC